MPRPARSSRRPQIAPPSPDFGVRLPRHRKRITTPALTPGVPGSGASGVPPATDTPIPASPPTPAGAHGVIDPDIVFHSETPGTRAPSLDTQRIPPTVSPDLDQPQGFAGPDGGNAWQSSRGFRFATHLLIFSGTLAAGMIWFKWQQAAPETQAPAPTVSPTPPPPPARRLPAETFDFIYRLRESTMVGSQLDRHFSEAQNLYRENQFDEFLDLDPWELPLDQLSYLNHFCDKGFFSAEREILIALLENQINRTAFSEPVYHGSSAVAARLGAAVQTHEQRLNDLRLAIEIYNRGRDGEIVVPSSLPSDQDQALRASVVQKLAAERRKRDALDQTIASLQARLNGNAR